MDPGATRRLLSRAVVALALGLVVYLGWIGGRPRLDEAGRARLLEEADQDLLASRLVDAERKFRRVAASDPASARAAFGMGLTSLRAGRHEEALTALDRAERLEPGNLDHRFVRAHALAQMGRRGEAADLYASILASDPSRLDAAEERIGLLIEVGQWEPARREAAEALERAPGRYTLRILAGRIEGHQGAHAKAIEHYEQARGIRPDSPQPIYGLIEEYRSLGRIEEAAALAPLFERLKGAARELDELRARAAAHPADPEPAARYVERIFDAGRLQEGVEQAGGFLTRFPAVAGRRGLALRAAEGAARIGDAASARRFLGTVREGGELDAGESLAVAEVLAEIGETDGARALFEERMKDRAGDPRALVGLGRLALSDGDPAAAESALRRALQEEPGRADGRALLGLALIQKGETAAGEAELNRALEVDPDQVDALFGLGFLAHQRRDPARAERYLRRAFEERPGHVQTRVVLALALSDEGRCEEAIPLFTRALEAEYSNVSLHAGLIRCLDLTGRVAEAQQARDVARKLVGVTQQPPP